jgi:diguanylate cyclase (GGDEF)-like protein
VRRRGLRALAQTAVGASRGDDEVIRWGGDEFIVLLADADGASVARVAARLVALARRTRVHVDGATRVRLSVSVGGTLARPQDTPATIVRRADDLLYNSKGTGRNRVTLEPDLVAAPPDAARR